MILMYILCVLKYYSPQYELLFFIVDGYYVYTDNAHSPAYLVSPEISLNRNTSYCLSYWYYVYGQPASAHLLVFITRSQMNGRPEWSRIIGQSSQWTQAQVTIDISAPLQVSRKSIK